MVFEDFQTLAGHPRLGATESDLERNVANERNLGERRVGHGPHVQKASARWKSATGRRQLDPLAEAN